MKVLVTGASGGLGRMVVKELLNKNFEVVACSRSESSLRNMPFYDKVIPKYYDLNAPQNINLMEYFDKPDACIHMAWDKLDNYRSNEHTEVILPNHKKFVENLVLNGIKSLTGVGSCYEYGLREGELTEDMPTSPTLPYSIAKNKLREFIEDICIEKNVSFKWLRIFYVFGEIEGRKNLYNHLMTAINSGAKEFNMSGGQQTRDFLTPNDVATNIAKVGSQNKVSGIVNCCSGIPVKLEDFVNAFLTRNSYTIKLNLGYFPYPDYEPMYTFGNTQKLKKID